MRPCRSTPPPCRAAGTCTEAAPASAGAPAHVNRYCHPIRVRDAARSDSTGELLGRVLEALSRQGELLEELLRRTEGEGYKVDTT